MAVNQLHLSFSSAIEEEVMQIETIKIKYKGKLLIMTTTYTSFDVCASKRVKQATKIYHIE
jgi:hypothetical protein